MGKVESVLIEIYHEVERQYELWGEQNHDTCRWFQILTEEIGEAAKAANNVEWQKYRQECVQAAAVLTEMIMCLDRLNARKMQQG